jgi:hypothetical protein
MKRQPELEQIQRFSVKTLDPGFVARAREGLGCSLCEAHASTELVKEVYVPWLTQPQPIHPTNKTANHRGIAPGIGVGCYQSYTEPSSVDCEYDEGYDVAMFQVEPIIFYHREPFVIAHMGLEA